MMVSRRLSFILLMTVNLVVMLHAILPHHHHEEHVCFAESHCTGHTDHHEDACTHSEQHQHHEHEDFESCTLNVTFLISDVKNQASDIDIQKIQRSFVIYVLDNELKNHFSDRFAILQSNHFPDNLIKRMTSSTRILRGPPVIS